MKCDGAWTISPLYSVLQDSGGVEFTVGRHEVLSLCKMRVGILM